MPGNDQATAPLRLARWTVSSGSSARSRGAVIIEDERVVAGMNVNVWEVSETIGELIRSRVRVDRARLTDPDVELSELVGAGG